MANIVVIGGGAAGIGACWGLTKRGHRVTLIEREAALGGHCLAVPVPTTDGGSVMVDVGVSDFNRATFTNVCALFGELGLGCHPVGQDASFMHGDGRLAWHMRDGQAHATEPFTDPERFAAEIARFRRECVAVLDDASMRDVTLADYCDRYDYSDEFRQLYLYPRAQGSFPMPDCDPATYPVCGLVAFWRIHGLAGELPADRNVLNDGMASYGAAFARWLVAQGGEVVLGGSVIGVARRDDGVRMRYVAADDTHATRRFDHVVFAVRGEQVLPLIEDAGAEEQALFGALRWHRARVVVHSDARLMPDDRAGWGAYNYVLGEGDVPAIRPTITFYPAKLAGIAGIDDVFVTMNPFREPDPASIIHNQFFSHPAAGSGGHLAVARLAELQGVRSSWYCGSYLIQPWVHEQAMASGVDLAALLHDRVDSNGGELPWLDDFLRSIPLFAGLDPFAIADIRLSAAQFDLAEGEILFEQGDAADAVYLVAEGEIAVIGRTPGDGQVELAHVGRGGLIGEVALLDGDTRSATAKAVSMTRGYRIDIARLTALRASGRPAAFEVVDRLRSEVARRATATIATIDKRLNSGGPALPRRGATSAPFDRAGQPLTGDQLSDWLARLPGFGRLDRAEWSALAALCRRVDAPRGTLIARAGDPATHLCMVARGAIRAALPRPGEAFEQLLIHGPGRMVGLAPMLDGGVHPLTLDVREEATVIMLPRADFAALRIGHGALAGKLFDIIGQQLVGDLRRLSRHLGRLSGDTDGGAA